jgi:hypothetical protein
MKTSKAVVAFLIWVIVTVGAGSVGLAGDGPKLPLKRYEGQIKAIKIERCGIEPGQCIGSIILAQKGGGEVTLEFAQGHGSSAAITSCTSRIWQLATK